MQKISFSLKNTQRELKGKLREAREQHRLWVKEAFLTKDTKKMWDCVKGMTNLKTGNRELYVCNEFERANELNLFYKRFDTGEGGDVSGPVCNTHRDRIVIDIPAVVKVFKALHTKKASGPDGISPFILHEFADELAPAWCPLFQLSVDTHVIPTQWKRAIIIPVPKISCPQDNNDYRAIATTSVVMKSFERIMLGELCTQI